MVVLAPFIPYIAGAAGLGSSLLKNQAKYSQYDYNNEQIRAQNRARQQAYNYNIQKAQFDRAESLKIFGARVNQFREQVQMNNQDLARSYEREQVRLNDIFDKAANDNLDLQIQLLQTQGLAGNTEQQGRRSGMKQQALAAEFGRAQAKQTANLQRAERNSAYKMEDSRRSVLRANRQAWAPVSVAPSFAPLPPAPLLRQTYDYSGERTADLFGSLLSGVQTGLGFA